jgi:predicted ATPase
MEEYRRVPPRVPETEHTITMSSTRPTFFVLSGGPCSGKTTAVRELERRGQHVVHEAATEIIEDPRTSQLRHDDPVEFQRLVLEHQLAKEARALESEAPGGHVFLDRGVADGFAYLRYNGHEFFTEIVDAWELVAPRYRAILLLEQNPEYEEASHRAESAESARELANTIREEYESRHSVVITIPWGPVEERVDLILTEAQRLA